MNSDKSDGLNDDLGRRLNDLIPEAGSGYWNRIDSMLESVEAERGHVGDGSHLGQDDTDTDTDGTVIRLTDMNTNGQNERGVGFNNRLMLVAAAAIVAVLAVGGILAVNRGSANSDVATDDNGTTTVSTTTVSTTTVSTTSTLPDEVAEPEPDRDGEADVAAVLCYHNDDAETFRGEAATRMTVYSNGAVTAVERYDNGLDRDESNTATGFVLDEAAGTYSMKQDLGGQTYTRVWVADDMGLSTGEDTYFPAADCTVVEEFLSGVVAPEPVTPDNESIVPVLDVGRYCYAGSELVADAYEVEVIDDGGVVVKVFSYSDPNLLLQVLETGAGRFASDTEMALNLDSWTGLDLVEYSTIFTIADRGLQPTVYTDAVAEEVDCSVVDRLAAKDHGYEIFKDERLRFAVGASSQTVEGGFIRGEADVYRAEASKGQTFTATISSLEDNASVAVYTPEGYLIFKDESGGGSGSVVLPADGVYEVLVSGIRGNVSYTLTVEIT